MKIELRLRISFPPLSKQSCASFATYPVLADRRGHVISLGAVADGSLSPAVRPSLRNLGERDPLTTRFLLQLYRRLRRDGNLARAAGLHSLGPANTIRSFTSKRQLLNVYPNYRSGHIGCKFRYAVVY